jgi:hypothetical protein
MLAPDRPRHRTVDDDDARLERRRVLGQPLSRIERKEREVPASVLEENPTRNAIVGRNDERPQRERLRRFHCLRHLTIINER